ncbi:tetratricopeptide repeat protein [Flavobacterium faecale]|uniref:tetratricopeptide repeat protein n=1 Tax=Flavobacterium faecale TaxID=1355330 RepID=UPI00131F0E8B|nr:hypothetical protein [Flavobacterium faecale]
MIIDPDAKEESSGNISTAVSYEPNKVSKTVVTPVENNSSESTPKKAEAIKTAVTEKPKVIVANKTVAEPKKTAVTKTATEAKKEVIIATNSSQKTTLSPSIKKEAVTNTTETTKVAEQKPLPSISKPTLTAVVSKQEMVQTTSKPIEAAIEKPTSKSSPVIEEKNVVTTEVAKPNVRNLTPVLKLGDKGAKNGARPVFTPVGKIEPTAKQIEEKKVNEYVQTNEKYNEVDEEAEKAALNVLISNIKKEERRENGEKVTAVYVNIIETYERVAEKGYRSAYLFRVIADSFYFSGKMDKAARWYNELFGIKTKLEPVYYYRYGATLIKTGETEKGNAMIEKFSELEHQ